MQKKCINFNKKLFFKIFKKYDFNRTFLSKFQITRWVQDLLELISLSLKLIRNEVKIFETAISFLP